MEKGSVEVLWRTDGHLREGQVVDGMGGDRGGNWVLLPLDVRLTDEESSRGEAKADNQKPRKSC